MIQSHPLCTTVCLLIWSVLLAARTLNPHSNTLPQAKGAQNRSMNIPWNPSSLSFQPKHLRYLQQLLQPLNPSDALPEFWVLLSTTFQHSNSTPNPITDPILDLLAIMASVREHFRVPTSLMEYLRHATLNTSRLHNTLYVPLHCRQLYNPYPSQSPSWPSLVS